MERVEGKILWFRDRDGNGIILDDDGNEWYFDVSVIVDPDSISEDEKGLRVSFIHNDKITDCRCAKDVRLI